MNKTKIIFSQKLDIDPIEFIEVWNNTAECRAIAEAHLSQATKTQFIDFPFLQESIEFIAGAVTGGALNDSIKIGIKMCIDKIKKKDTKIKDKEIEQADGSKLLKIELDDDEEK